MAGVVDSSLLRADTFAERPRRIGLLSYRSTPTVGGQGVYVSYLSKALAARGHEVTVISGPPYPDLAEGVALEKLPSLDLYAKPHNGHFALRPWHLLRAEDTYEYFGHLSGKFTEPYTFGQRAYRFLSKNRHKFDCLIDNQTLATGILNASKNFGLPLLTVIHHPITHDRRLALEAAEGWKQRLLVRRWYAFHRMQVRVARRLPLIVSPSDSARKDLATAFGLTPEKIRTVPLGVDTTAFRPYADVEKHPSRIITTASADVPLKGLRYLLSAFAELREEFPDLELVVVGTLRKGPTKRTLEELGLTEAVRFISDLSREELAREFAAATVAVTPSLYEGFGLPAAEAMACGTAIVVTDGGSLPEVAGTAGKVVPRANASALAQAIASLLRDPDERRRAEQACLLQARRFDWAQLVPSYEDLLDEVAEQC